MYTYTVEAPGKTTVRVISEWKNLAATLSLYDISLYNATVVAVEGIDMGDSEVHYLPLLDRLIVSGAIGSKLIKFLREVGFRHNRAAGTMSAGYTLELADLFQVALKVGNIPTCTPHEADPSSLWYQMRQAESDLDRVRDELAQTTGPKATYLLRLLAHKGERIKLMKEQHAAMFAVFNNLRSGWRVCLRDGRMGTIDRVNNLSIGFQPDGEGAPQTVPLGQIKFVLKEHTHGNSR